MSERMPEPARPAGGYRRTVELRTRWSDEDNHGVLNNAVYLTLFEEARHALFDELGAMDGARFPFVLAQASVAYRRPGRGGCAVSIDVATLHVGTRSFSQAYRVRGPDGSTWCEADARLVAVDAGGAACEMPPALAAAARALA